MRVGNLGSASSPFFDDVLTNAYLELGSQIHVTFAEQPFPRLTHQTNKYRDQQSKLN